MGNAPPEGLKPSNDAEAAKWAAEDAQAMRMPRYVPVASLGNYERPTMQQIRDMFLFAPGGRGYFGLPRVDASYDVDLLGGGGGARFITADVETLSVKQLKALISAAGLSMAGCVEKSDLRARATEAQSRLAPISCLSNAQLMAALVRLPREDHGAISLVDKRFRKLVRDGAFTVARKRCPLTGASCLERTLFVVGGTKRAHGAMHGETSMLASGRWLKCCAVPERVRGNSCAVAHGELYSLQGDHGNPMMGACQCFMIYSPALNQWRGGPLCPDGRVMSAVVACNDKIYVIGGQTTSMCGQELSTCFRYDPERVTSGGWERIPSMPADGAGTPEGVDYEAGRPQFCHTMGKVAVGNTIYIFGGQVDDGPGTDRVLALDTDTLAWRWCERMPAPRVYPECHARGTDVYVFGGCGNCYQDTKETTWKYDTVTDTWTTLADAPGPHNHVFVENGEYFSAFGHVANEGPISYHVPTDTWVEGSPGFPVLQQGHANGCGFALAMLP